MTIPEFRHSEPPTQRSEQHCQPDEILDQSIYAAQDISGWAKAISHSSLPCYPRMTDVDVGRVIIAVSRIVEAHGA